MGDNNSENSRRKFLKTAVIGAVGTGLAVAAGCELTKNSSDKDEASSKAPALNKGRREWKMVTTWPKDFPGLGTGANALAEMITKMSDGRLEVKVYGAGELVPAFGTFDAVSKGTVEMGHGAAYYWKGKVEAAQFFAAVPFGLNAEEMDGWIYYGGGQELWNEAYADFNIRGYAAGNTGVQMGGWFNKEINSVDDLKGLKMRMPGLGADVLKEVGALPVSLPGGEIFQALQTGTIDATEWVGPYNDLAFGFYKVAKYYYWPGWHEPGTTLEAIVNKDAYEDLPSDLQAIVDRACQAANGDMYGEFTARNQQALETLINEHGVNLKRFPDAVMKRLGDVSLEVVADVGNRDALSRKIYNSFNNFRKGAVKWDQVGAAGFSNARSLVLS